MYRVYKIISEDGKIYIGCTKQLMRLRIGQHRCMEKPFALMPHKIEVLHEVETKEQGEILEAYYIEKFETCDPLKGWNRRLGGGSWGFPEWVNAGFGKKIPAARNGLENGMYGKKHSPETIEKIRQKALGRPSALKGEKLSDEVRIRKNAARAGKGFLRGEAHPMFGRHHSEEAKAKIGAARRLRFFSS